MEKIIGFLDRLFELFLAAEDHMFFLHVGREAIGHVVFTIRAVGPGLVSACQPCVKAAADRAVHQIDDVPRWSENHTFTSRIGAPSLGNNSRDGTDIGLYLGDGFGIVDNDCLASFLGNFRWVFLYQLLPYCGRIR